MKYLFQVVLALSLLLSTNAHARSIPEIHGFMMDEIKRLSTVLDETVDQDETTFNEALNRDNILSEYEFAKFGLRLKASVGFDVFFGKVELIPNIELFWK